MPLAFQTMIESQGYAALSSNSALVPFRFKRKEPDSTEVLIDILYCGICHADIHQAKNEYGATLYPLVPGHEIVGRVSRIGESVTKFKKGDLVGVGYLIHSCRHCESCGQHEEQYCEKGIMPTQNGKLSDGSVTKGGYSDRIVVDEAYVLSVPESLPTPGVAPLLCAGITAYSALKHWKVGPGHRVAVLGLGGIGHLAVKFAHAFGAEVTVLSTSASKEASAYELGADHFVLTTDQTALKQAASSFDFILNTVSARHDYHPFLKLLRKEGTMILLGVPPEASALAAHALTSRRRTIAGSFIGSITEMQEMLNFCAEKNITAHVEVIAPDYINEAFKRTLKADVQYRFVIDMSQLA